MNIVILTEGPFPYGMASTNRIIAYSRGLVELSHNVHVFCIKPSESIDGPILNKQVEGRYKGIDFKYPSGSTKREKYLVLRIIASLKGIIRTLVLIIKMRRNVGIDAVFMGLTNFLYTFLIYIFCRFNKIKFVQARGEYPFIGVNNFLQRFRLSIYLHITCKLFDGLFVNTEALMQYFQKFIRKNTKMMILPMLVEPDRFLFTEEKIQTDSEFIAYCGVLSDEKDGVPILIDAFNEIALKHKNINLHLIGDTKNIEFNKIIERVTRYNLMERVVFTGRVEREELPVYINQARILALARPESKQAEGGFPSKLGEYLATGKPVVITSVGEIQKYMKDGENAFIAKPNDPKAFAEKLDFALSNPELAEKIGKEGKKLVYKEFNYKVQSQKLADFITSL